MTSSSRNSLAGNVVVVVFRFVSVVNISLFKSTLGMLDKAISCTVYSVQCTVYKPPVGLCGSADYVPGRISHK